MFTTTKTNWVEEVRVLDTRTDGQTKPAKGSTRKVKLDLPAELADAKAVTITLTTAHASGEGFFSVWASGKRPNTSKLNVSVAGKAIANTTSVALDKDHSFNVYTSEGDHIIIDLIAVHS